MSSAGTRQRSLFERRIIGQSFSDSAMEKHGWFPPKLSADVTSVGKQITVSESHPRDRSTGSYRSGGPFYTSLVRSFVKAPNTAWHHHPGAFYFGPVYGVMPTTKEQEALGYGNVKGEFGASNEASMNSLGTTAIAQCAPTNPASDLGTSLAESFREGVPSLPGIESWKRRTKILKDLGSEYLNYQFGWAPLKNEVNSVGEAARNHRDLLKQYHRGEGSDTHRRFVFPSVSNRNSLPEENPGLWSGLPWEWFRLDGTRKVSLVKETKRWFEGVFTYALPSSADNWHRSIGFGSDADALFGLQLTPEVLWELTPWSWAVDWFSNAQDVIHNVDSFGAAGLVMRYGYMMEETIEKVVAEGHCPSLKIWEPISGKPGTFKEFEQSPGTYSCGVESVTKRRVPASPFGFGIGWEGLSPTQLAITAALGITRLL